jgi:geranylgeranyl diphosphate/geranylgeranyl-bacteriochlorophyllide a reductase
MSMGAFDAVIAGAGPAGATAARDLALAGARVALVDGSHPREKPCGGGVTGRALDLVGATIAPGAGQAIDTVTFEAGGRSASVALPGNDALKVFPRETFDAALLQQAIDAGALHIPARVTAVARNGARWSIDTATGRIETPWLLGADGPAGVVRKRVFRPFERRQLSIAAGSYVDGIDTGEIVIGFTDRPRGYLWCFPRAGHLAVGTCAQADETTTEEMHAVTDRWLDRYAPAARLPRRRYAWPIPSLDARDLDAEQPAGDGWMLLGDAAGLVDPITREGIFFALRSGTLAAAALSASAPAPIYADAVRDDLHDELRRAARLKAGFFGPGFTSLLIDALEHSERIRAVMLDLIAGRQPYAGLKRRLLGTLEFGLMTRVLTSRYSRPARAR